MYIIPFSSLVINPNISLYLCIDPHIVNGDLPFNAGSSKVESYHMAGMPFVGFPSPYEARKKATFLYTATFFSRNGTQAAKRNNPTH